jgi:hypothetical protein
VHRDTLEKTFYSYGQGFMSIKLAVTLLLAVAMAAVVVLPLECPFEFCDWATSNGTTKVGLRNTQMRSHVNSKHASLLAAGNKPPVEWLRSAQSVLCSNVTCNAISSEKKRTCKCGTVSDAGAQAQAEQLVKAQAKAVREEAKAARISPPPPLAEFLPALTPNLSKGQTAVRLRELREGAADQGGVPSSPMEDLDPGLLSICMTDVAMLKRLPNATESVFAATWASLLNEALYTGDKADWWYYFAFPKAILLAPPRGGKRISKKRSYTQLIYGRIQTWREGVVGIELLWSKVVKAAEIRKAKGPSAQSASKSKEAKSVAMLRDGDVKKALQNLTSAPIAERSVETWEKLKDLHPAGVPVRPRAPDDILPEAPRFSSEVVYSALCSFNPCAAGGLFGYKPSLLQACAKADSFHYLNALTNFTNRLSNGTAPAFLKPFIAGATSIALMKNATKIRPLASGAPERRLVGKCFCLGGKDEISEVFKGMNYGVGCPGGVEVVAHSLRDTLERLSVPGSTKGLLKIDFKNAFNLVERNAIIDSTSRLFPGLSRWTAWCYEQPTLLLYGHEWQIASDGGAQQGDPLAPLYFSCPLQEIITDINALVVSGGSADYNKWYMDDGGIIGEPELLQQVWDILVTKGPALGMILNASKSEWSWLDPDNTDPCPIRALDADGTESKLQIAMVPTDKIQMLGVPLGSDAEMAAFVANTLKQADSVFQELGDWDDSQAAYFLLRSSYSITRATHFLRTTPIAAWGDEACAFDHQVRGTAEKIFGFPFTEKQYEQASTSSSVGGLSLRKCTDHALGAYNASWNESKAYSKEAWRPRPELQGLPRMNQRNASAAIDLAKIEVLKSNSTKRDVRKLERLQLPHANAWLSAVPSQVGRADNVLPPLHMIVAVKRLLSVPIHADPAPCPFCKQTMNIYGDHSISCSRAGDIITRHNRLRNLVGAISEEGRLSPELEKLGILGDEGYGDLRRPGDVTLPVWGKGKGLAIDVAVIDPINKTNLASLDPCEQYAANQKHGKYDASFVGSNYDFTALVFETTGGVCAEGEAILRQLFRFAAKQTKSRYCVFAARAWARVSISVQRSVAQQILNRMPAVS